MQTVGAFLTECGTRLAPFDRLRVGRVGCGFSLAGIVTAIVLIATGVWDTGGSWAAGFRYVVLSGLSLVILLFVVYALRETLAERSIRSGIDAYMKATGTDLETLLKAAEMRQTQMPGGARMVAVLKRIAQER